MSKIQPKWCPEAENLSQSINLDLVTNRTQYSKFWIWGHLALCPLQYAAHGLSNEQDPDVEG